MTAFELSVSMSVLFAGAIVGIAAGAEAQTSATTGSIRGQNGNAAATASYVGDRGFAHTESQSGRISSARGVAVGVDEDGVAVSVSDAISTPTGPAIATNFNVSIGRAGEVSTSGGVSVANGESHRSAEAGGRAAVGRGGATGSAFAGGRTDDRGEVRASTFSAQSGPRFASASEPVRVMKHSRIFDRRPSAPERGRIWNR